MLVSNFVAGLGESDIDSTVDSLLEYTGGSLDKGNVNTTWWLMRR